jgi:hypothetical protein
MMTRMSTRVLRWAAATLAGSASRTHLSLAKDSPVPRPVQSPLAGNIVATPAVGGLHHRYERVAA